LRRQTVGDTFERTVKILTDREESVWLQLAEHEAELLFYAVNSMKEIAPVYLQFLTAQLPIGAEKEVITKNGILGFRKSALAD
jgi:hypothetical protein